jgi:hypothetical protein
VVLLPITDLGNKNENFSGIVYWELDRRLMYGRRTVTPIVSKPAPINDIITKTTNIIFARTDSNLLNCK